MLASVWAFYLLHSIRFGCSTLADLPELGSSEQGDEEVCSDQISGARKRPLSTVQEQEDLGRARRTDSTLEHQKKRRLGAYLVSTCSSRGSGWSMTRLHFEPTARERSEDLVDVARVRDVMPVKMETW